jgi:drug/metabolite transporter (DMT)-like permease
MRHLFFMIGSAICLASIGIFTKLIGDIIPVITLSFLRLLIAFLFLVVIMLFIDRPAFRESKKNLKEYFWVGLVMAISFSFYIGANIFAPIQNAVLLSYTSPFFVLLFAKLILKEKITKTKIITLFIAFFGLMIINPFNAGSFMFGNSLALINAIFFALFLTYLRKEEDKHDLGDIMWFFFFATILLLPLAIYYGFGNFLSVWPFLLGLGIVSTGLAYFLMNLAYEGLEAEGGSMITMIVTPLTAIILAIIFLNENLNLRIILGGVVLIIAGLYLEYENLKHKK